MIALEFDKRDLSERKKIVEKFREKNLENRRKSKIKKIENWCKKYLSDVDGKCYNFHAVIEALPEELLKIKEYLDSEYDVDTIMKDLLYNKKSYIETTLYNRMHNEAKNILLENLNVVVCPYCNRNYIFADENINTCELDHFIPKSRYPIFASSFYNLIPSCPYCNGKKGEKDFKIYPHVTKKMPDELVRFTYNILGSNYLKKVDDLDIVLDVLDENYLTQAKILRLEELYKHHKDIVQEILKKREIFSDTYMKGLCEEFPNLFKTQEDIEELVYGVSMKKNDYGKRPLSKMMHDIIEEVKV